MRYVEYTSERDNMPGYGVCSFEDFAAALAQSHTTSPCTLDNCKGKDCPHKRGDSWSPGIVSEGLTRAAAHVEAITALVLDLDDVSEEQIEAAEVALAPYSYIVHGSHSYRGAAPYRVRIIVELAAEVPVKDWRQWRGHYKSAAVALLGLHVKDESCCNADRLFFLPSGPQGAPKLCYHHAGAPLDLNALLAIQHTTVEPKAQDAQEIEASDAPPANVAEIVLAIREVQRSSAAKKDPEWAKVALACKNFLNQKALLDAMPGGAHFQARENTIHRLCAALAFKISTGTPASVIAELFKPTIAMSFCEPEGVDHYVACVESSFDRSQREKIKRDVDEKLIKDRVHQSLAQPSEPAEDDDQGMSQIDASWLDRLQQDKQGNYKSNTLNVDLILSNNPDLSSAFRFNAVTKEIDVSLGIFKGENGETLEIPLAAWFNERVCIDIAPERLVKHIYRLARKNSFDPLADRLNALQWDRVSRLGTVLEDYFNALVIDPTTGEDCRAYLRLVGQAWFISAAARALSPGEKVDTALIIEGKTGAGKSTIFKKLAYDEYFQDSKINLENKDAGLVAGRKWIVEMGELSALKKHDPETIKTFISSSVDSLRAPYARAPEDFPRRAVFVGTTEESDYLESNTNRRFWSVAVGAGEIDIDRIIRDRDQLWAEAVYLYRQGVKWYFKESSTEAGVIRDHVSGRRIRAPLEDQIKLWFATQKIEKRPLHVTAHEVATKVLMLAPSAITNHTYKQIGHAMRALGFKSERATSGERVRFWATPQQLLGSFNDATKAN